MMNLAGLARAAGGTWTRRADDLRVTGVSTDSRSLRPGDLFAALRGPTHDGHDHVLAAFAGGAIAALVERALEDAPGPQLVVQDSTAALGLIAGCWRLTHPARFVSVSGSNGKTTTKEMLAHLLAGSRRVVKAPASFNNNVGVPLTIFSAVPGTEFVVLEIGTNHRGEIADLGRISRPDVAVITSIGEEHLEGLGDVEGVAAEEAEILRFVRAGGMVIAPADCPPLAPHLERVPREKLVTFGTGPGADVRVTEVAPTAEGLRFRAFGTDFEVPVQGSWNATNAAAAVAAAVAFGLEPAECAARLREFRGPKMRMELLRIGGVEILNDAYNANPSSARLAVAEFGRRPAAGRKIAVLGDMRELGDGALRFHLELGRAVAAEPTIGTVLLIGPEARAMKGALREDQGGFDFPTVDAARDALRGLVRPGDCLLLKGSRAVGLEKVVKIVAEAVPTRSGPAPLEVH